MQLYLLLTVAVVWLAATDAKSLPPVKHFLHNPLLLRDGSGTPGQELDLGQPETQAPKKLCRKKNDEGVPTVPIKLPTPVEALTTPTTEHHDGNPTPTDSHPAGSYAHTSEHQESGIGEAFSFEGTEASITVEDSHSPQIAIEAPEAYQHSSEDNKPEVVVEAFTIEPRFKYDKGGQILWNKSVQ